MLIKYLNPQLKRLCIRVVTDQFYQLANQSAHTVHHVYDNYGNCDMHIYGMHNITNQSMMIAATVDKYIRERINGLVGIKNVE